MAPRKQPNWMAIALVIVSLIALVLAGTLYVVIQNVNSGLYSAKTVTPSTQVTLPDAVTVMPKTKLPEFYDLTGIQRKDVSSFPSHIKPDSYAVFSICEGAGGSGCTPVSYALAIYSQIVDANSANIDARQSGQWSWTMALSHCILMSDDFSHFPFLSMESAVSNVYPCSVK
jgi:hypothetical protein